MTYYPKPIDTSKVQVPEQLLQLVELLAENVHEQWAQRRMQEGWSYGEQRDDSRLQHPGLVPYEELSEQEKDYDRTTAMETIRVILKQGYQVIPPQQEE